jgi:hypothetical protein
MIQTGLSIDNLSYIEGFRELSCLKLPQSQSSPQEIHDYLSLLIQETPISLCPTGNDAESHPLGNEWGNAVYLYSTCSHDYNSHHIGCIPFPQSSNWLLAVCQYREQAIRRLALIFNFPIRYHRMTTVNMRVQRERRGHCQVPWDFLEAFRLHMVKFLTGAVWNVVNLN